MDLSRVLRSVALAVLTVPLMPGATVAEAAGGWEFSVAPLYTWAKSVDGTSAVGPTESELDLNFREDLLGNIDAAAAVHVEARQGALVFFGEYNYARLDPSVKIDQGPVVIRGDIEFTDIAWELGFRYEFANSGTVAWQVLGGVRGLDQDLDILLKRVDSGPYLGVLPTEVSGGDDWWHGFGGLRVTTKLAERWLFVARGDYGYKNSNNKSYMLEGIFDYRFRDWGSVFFGYRHLAVDYANNKSGLNNYSFDGANRGPLVGLNFYF